jgi:hypothetical protein
MKLYNWDKDDLEDDEGLVESDTAHPDLPAKFPGIDLKSEQPHHHQVVEVIEESNYKRIYAAQCNVSLDDLPCRTTGVSTAVDEVQIDHWANPPDKNDLYHDIAMHPTLVVPPIPIHMTDIDDDNNATDDETINAKAAKMEEAVLGSTTINGRRLSTCNRTPTRFTKVSFDNKSYSDGQYKEGTIHITVDSGHDTDHPSPINPDPLMHVLGIAMLHYTNLDAQAVAFAQSYSFKAGLKKIGDVGKIAAMTELTQLHTYVTYHPVHANFLSPDKRWQSLSSLMNIVEKRDGRVWARACANGSQEQRQPGYKMENGASPTVATYSIMVTATINAHEQCFVATIDIPGAFLNAYNNKETFMLLKGCLAKLMAQVNPNLY